MEYLFAQGDKYLDEVIQERAMTRYHAQFPQTPIPLKSLQDSEYKISKNLPETENENAFANNSKYSKYGKEFSPEFIEKMLKDKRFQNAMKTRTEKNEGGYANHTNDSGKETNYGISKKIYPNEDIKNLTKERAMAILYRDFWNYKGINTLPDQLVNIVFDNAVLQGQPTAIINLHKALGITPGQIIGKQTHEKIKQKNFEDIRKNFKKAVQNREEEIVAQNPKNKVFEKGWRNRSNKY